MYFRNPGRRTVRLYRLKYYPFYGYKLKFYRCYKKCNVLLAKKKKISLKYHLARIWKIFSPKGTDNFFESSFEKKNRMFIWIYQYETFSTYMFAFRSAYYVNISFGILKIKNIERGNILRITYYSTSKQQPRVFKKYARVMRRKIFHV